MSDSVTGIPPTVAIEQRTSRGGRKSTVATLTEIYPFLRLLYVKLGMQYLPGLPTCPIEPLTLDGIVARSHQAHIATQTVNLFAPLVSARKGIYSELARWARGARATSQLRVDGKLVPTAQVAEAGALQGRTTSSCRWARLRVTRASEPRLRAAARARPGTGQGHSAGCRPQPAATRCRSFSVAPRLPQLRQGFCGSGSAAVLVQQRARLVRRAASAPAWRSKQFDAEQTGEEGAWLECGAGPRRPAPACDGQAPQRHRRWR